MDLKKELAGEIGLANLDALYLYRTKFVTDETRDGNAEKKPQQNTKKTQDDSLMIDLYSKQPLRDDELLVELLRDSSATPYLQAMVGVNVKVMRGLFDMDEPHQIRLCELFNSDEFESELKRVMPKFRDYHLRYVYTEQSKPTEDQKTPFDTLSTDAIMEVINNNGVFHVLGKRSWLGNFKIALLFLAVAHVIIGTYIFIL